MYKLMKNKISIKKKNYDKFIFKGSLALEFYFDINNDNIDLYHNFINNLKKYRKLEIKDDKSKENFVKELTVIIEEFGLENFTIYNNGDIEYNFQKNN